MSYYSAPVALTLGTIVRCPQGADQYVVIQANRSSSLLRKFEPDERISPLDLDPLNQPVSPAKPPPWLNDSQPF